MAQLVAEELGDELYHYYPMGRHVVRARGVCGGRPTFRYTRIEIAGPLQRLASGETLDEIVAAAMLGVFPVKRSSKPARSSLMLRREGFGM